MYTMTHIVMAAALAAFAISSGCNSQSAVQNTSPQRLEGGQEPKALQNTRPQEAATRQEPEAFSIFGGYIVSLTADAITVKVQGKAYTLRVSSQTRFIGEDGLSISPTDLNPGNFVRVTTKDATDSEAYTIMKAKDTGWTGVMRINAGGIHTEEKKSN
jgi:hypothetical protein